MPYMADSPFKSISILYRKSHIWLNSGCAQYHLSAAQAVVILIVCDFGGLTQDEITKRLSLDKSVIAKTVTKLEETVYPAVKEQVDESFRLMTHQMTDAEREEFKRLLLLAADASLALDE